MQTAIDDARKYKHHFGAVIVKNNKIIASGNDRPPGDPRFHAETTAILATKKRSLEGCILYSTSEPCPMCFYMAWITGIKNIVYGSTIKDAAKAGHPQIITTNKYLNKKSGKKIKLTQIMRKECKELLNE